MSGQAEQVAWGEFLAGHRDRLRKMVAGCGLTIVCGLVSIPRM